MATDQKLISQLLDLGRNIEKLSGEVKKNTTVNKDLVKADSVEGKPQSESKDVSKIVDGFKSMDFKGLKDEFKGLKDGLKGIDKLDFKGLENGLKSLDFKGLEKGLKGLDFKGLENGLKGLDIKGLKDSFKGISDIKNLDIGGITKNLTSGAGVKDLISGSIGNIGKGILGAFESGGVVKTPGSYLVGEKGPEIAQLPKNTTVIPNDKTEAILSGKQPSVKNRMKEMNSGRYPTKEQIAAKKSELLAEDPDFYSDPSELADEIEYYIQNYKNKDNQETFTKEDIAKLGKPTAKPEIPGSSEASKITQGEVQKKSTEVDQKQNPELVEKKPGLFAKAFSRENIKDVAGKIGSGASGILGGGLKDKLTGSLKGSAEMLISKANLNIPDVAKSGIASGLSYLDGSKNLSDKQGLLGDVKKNLPKLSNLPSVKPKTESIQKSVTNTETKESQSITPQNITANPIASDSASSESASSKNESSSGTEAGITKKDIEDILSALGRIGSLLEGPLSISTMDSPLRPDSRRV